MAKSRARPKRSSGARGLSPALYTDLTREPLYCLAFLFPLVAVYEMGALLLRPAALTDRLLLAPSFIHDSLAWLGAVGPWVPGVALLATLLMWHVLSERNWHLRAWVPLVMLVESLALAMPLLILSELMLQAGRLSLPADAVKTRIVAALGAAIYEEALFRFGLVSAMIALLIDVARVPRRFAVPVTCVVSAMAFALLHCKPLGAENFAWLPFLLRSVAGAYLAVIFVMRGLGICTGAHAAYNVITILKVASSS